MRNRPRHEVRIADRHKSYNDSRERTALLQSALVESVPFARLLQLEIINLTPHGAKVGIGCQGATSKHLEKQHPGALFTLGETAPGAAVANALVERLDRLLPIVRSAEITYLKQTGRAAVATATLARSREELIATLDAVGRVETTVAVELRDVDDRHVGQMTVTWAILVRKPVPQG